MKFYTGFFEKLFKKSFVCHTCGGIDFRKLWFKYYYKFNNKPYENPQKKFYGYECSECGSTYTERPGLLGGTVWFEEGAIKDVERAYSLGKTYCKVAEALSR